MVKCGIIVTTISRNENCCLGQQIETTYLDHMQLLTSTIVDGIEMISTAPAGEFTGTTPFIGPLSEFGNVNEHIMQDEGIKKKVI